MCYFYLAHASRALLGQTKLVKAKNLKKQKNEMESVSRDIYSEI